MRPEKQLLFLMKTFKKIVLVGAAGVGKTTLINELSKLNLFAGYDLIPEIARNLCEDKGYANIYEIPDIDQFRFEVLEKQIELENNSQRFIADRSTIDSWVYFDFWSKHFIDDDGKIIEKDMGSNRAKEFLEKAKEHSKIYDLIIFMPKVFSTPDDGFRWVNEEYQKAIEEQIKATLSEWDLLDKVHHLNV